MLHVKVIGGKTPIVEITGKLNPSTKGEAVEALRLVGEENPSAMVVDLTGAYASDPEAVAIVAEAAHSELGHGGRLAFVVAGARLRRAIRRAGLTDRPGVQIFENREEAIKRLAALNSTVA